MIVETIMHTLNELEVINLQRKVFFFTFSSRKRRKKIAAGKKINYLWLIPVVGEVHQSFLKKKKIEMK
jgi:hypothetical protein